jgi:hypothetical protein
VGDARIKAGKGFGQESAAYGKSLPEKERRRASNQSVRRTGKAGALKGDVGHERYLPRKVLYENGKYSF